MATKSSRNRLATASQSLYDSLTITAQSPPNRFTIASISLFNRCAMPHYRFTIASQSLRDRSVIGTKSPRNRLATAPQLPRNRLGTSKRTLEQMQNDERLQNVYKTYPYVTAALKAVCVVRGGARLFPRRAPRLNYANGLPAHDDLIESSAAAERILFGLL
jgi:hypothetical protein